MASQHIGDDSNQNQQINANGNANTASATTGGISITGDNHGIVVSSIPTPAEPKRTFTIAKKTRIPASAPLIGTVSGLITIGGFISGGISIKQLVDATFTGDFFDPNGGPHAATWWAFGSLIFIVAGIAGLVLFKFLRRNVLHLPKHRFFRAWAGIKEESGRTFPYSLRLRGKCDKCANQNLLFTMVPSDGHKLVDLETGAIKKHIVTKWAPQATCPRDDSHSIPVDISGNDFDASLAR